MTLFRHSRKGGNLYSAFTKIPPFAGMTMFLVLSASVANAESTPKDSFDSINKCVKREDANGCQDYFTASSIDLYNRFMSYGLMNCLPKDAKYYSEEKTGDNILLRASVTDYGKERYMRLLFAEEEGMWKLDVPESLRISMGKNWEKQIQMTEQVFLLMKQQLGSELDCTMIKGLVKTKK